LKANDLTPASLLFGETPSRVIVTFPAENSSRIRELAGDFPFEVIGRVSGDALKITVDERALIDASVAELETTWATSLANKLENSLNAAA
jgi:hypothetical protein